MKLKIENATKYRQKAGKISFIFSCKFVSVCIWVWVYVCVRVDARF